MTTPMTKICRLCTAAKPLDQFSKSAKYSDGLRSDCRQCDYANWKKRYDSNPEMRKKHYERQRKSWKAKSLKKKYNLTLQQYDEFVKAHGAKCFCCDKTTKLCIDHNHKTGKIRGLLCSSCNVGLGLFKENEIALVKAVEYLRFHQGYTT